MNHTGFAPTFVKGIALAAILSLITITPCTAATGNAVSPSATDNWESAIVATTAKVTPAVKDVRLALNETPNAPEQVRKAALTSIDVAEASALRVWMLYSLGVEPGSPYLNTQDSFVLQAALDALPMHVTALVKAQTSYNAKLTQAKKKAAAKATKPAAAKASKKAPAAKFLTTAQYRKQAEAFLKTLPGGKKVTIEWGDPQGHLGGVWMPGSSTIILNAKKLDRQLDRTKDVLRHEIGHIHQNWTMAKLNVSMKTYEARSNAVFGGVEPAADAVAIVLGASSVYYKSDFTKAQLNAARNILKDKMP
ncbi:MAG: hypothetical protein LBH13_06725 [Cellulomonadaceae bacterium]|jgi:hypothetical protein|nr:hypothetical protein [Cellulomonadaceae bacterium]